MRWLRIPLCLELVSPLHVGFLPNQAGTMVARTRCYLPGKNLWGALSAAATAVIHETPTARDFANVGQLLREQIRFSYFYLSDGEKVFTPDYGPHGLTWADVIDREFRSSFIGSQTSTALSEAGGAEDATLHEIEFIRHRVGAPGRQPRSASVVGSVWLREGTVIEKHPLDLRDGSIILRGVDPFGEISVGGEQNYGFGRLQRVAVSPACEADIARLWPEEPDTPLVTNSRGLTAHAPYRANLLFRGDVEILAGREYPPDAGDLGFQQPGQRVVNSGFFFAPGTHIEASAGKLRMDSWGRLLWA